MVIIFIIPRPGSTSARSATLYAEKDAERYEYERLKRRDREVMRSEDMPQDLAEAILKAEPPEESKRFDHEVR